MKQFKFVFNWLGNRVISQISMEEEELIKEHNTICNSAFFSIFSCFLALITSYLTNG
jgi:hypothetical protein